MTEPNKIIAFAKSLSAFTDDELVDLDREGLVAMSRELKELKRLIDKTLLRLSFMDDRQLN